MTRNIEAPTLILWGKQDKIINVEVANELKSLLKRAEAPVIPKTQKLKNPLADKLIPLN